MKGVRVWKKGIKPFWNNSNNSIINVCSSEKFLQKFTLLPNKYYVPKNPKTIIIPFISAWSLEENSIKDFNRANKTDFSFLGGDGFYMFLINVVSFYQGWFSSCRVRSSTQNISCGESMQVCRDKSFVPELRELGVRSF